MKSKNLHVGSGDWVRAWGPVLVWAATIFVLSALPGSAYPRTDLPNADKLVHVLIYGTLGALCSRALLRGRQELRLPSGLSLVAAAAALAALYGVSDEIHQLFVVGRSADWRDVAADAAGGLLGSGLAAAFIVRSGLRRRRRRDRAAVDG
jgi:VanZ family protein